MASFLQTGASAAKANGALFGERRRRGQPIRRSALRAVSYTHLYHMDRGYERIEEKLRGVGAQIERVSKLPAPEAQPAVAD